MKKNILKAGLVTALSASFLCAQIPFDSTTTTTTTTTLTPAQIAANLVARLTTLLTLSTTQQASALTVFTTEETTLASITTNMTTAQTALQTAILANSSSGMSIQSTTIGNLTTQQEEAVGTADAAFYALLTTTQQPKYTSLNLPGTPPSNGCAPTTTPTAAEQAAHIVSRLTSILTLTTAQQASATTIFTTEQTSLLTIATNMTTAQTALQTAILANSTAGINGASTQIGSLTAQQNLAEATADAAFYQTLSSTQQTQYTTLKLFDEYGGGQPGGQGGGKGPGGPPPSHGGGPGGH